MRKIEGGFKTTVGPGETLSGLLIETKGEEVKINTRGSGWKIENIGIIADGGSEESYVNCDINEKGTGVIENCFFYDKTGNFIFVNRKHEGRLIFRNVAFVENRNDPEPKEDAIYGSSPGNNGSKPIGSGGVIELEGCYAKDIGGYAFRISPDGSIVEDCTVVGDVNKAFANNFGGGFDGYEKDHYDDRPDGVLFKNINVGGGDISTGLQLGPHQSDHQNYMDYATITRVENFSVEADREIRPYEGRNNGTHKPTLNGEELDQNGDGIDIEDVETDEFNHDVDLSFPDGCPQSPLQAASGQTNDNTETPDDMHTLTIDGTDISDDDPVFYQFDGSTHKIEPGEDANIGDGEEIIDDRGVAEGRVNGGSDDWLLFSSHEPTLNSISLRGTEENVDSVVITVDGEEFEDIDYDYTDESEPEPEPPEEPDEPETPDVPSGSEEEILAEIADLGYEVVDLESDDSYMMLVK